MAKLRGYPSLTCYHNIPLAHVRFDDIVADSNFTDSDENRTSYGWLAERIGFYPIFLAFGRERPAIAMTRYSHQFLVLGGIRSTANNVLFEFDFDALSDRVIFTDYGSWCYINNHPLDERKPRAVQRTFHRSWSRKRWLDFANERGWNMNVQLLVPHLDLRLAKRVWARNVATKRKLERMGFRNVGIRRGSYIVPASK